MVPGLGVYVKVTRFTKVRGMKTPGDALYYLLKRLYTIETLAVNPLVLTMGTVEHWIRKSKVLLKV